MVFLTALRIDDVTTGEEIQVAPLPPPHSLFSSSVAPDMSPVVDSESRSNPDATTSQSSHTSSRAPLPSMPIPAAPRRAGPPRKKSARNLRAEGKVQDKEVHQVPLAPVEASEEPFDDERNLMQQESSLPDGLGAGSEHEEQGSSAQHGASDTREAVSEQGSDPLPEEGSRISAPASMKVNDEAIHPKEGIHEASHELATDMVEGTETDGTNIPQQEIEMHPSTLDDPTAQNMVNVIDTHDSHEPSYSAVDEPEVSEPAKSEVVLSGEQPANVDSTIPLVGQYSTLDPESESNGHHAFTSVVPSHVPIEPPADKTETETAGVPEPEPQTPIVSQGQTEEEADRRKRIAERLAKMGGRNPFSASPLGGLGPSIQGSGDEPHEVDHVVSHEESKHEGRSL
jgi:myosin tail region-interacting protein MTI1